MLRIRVLWFGRPTRSPFENLVEDYRKRVSRRWGAEDCPLRPSPRSGSVDRHKALTHEASVILDRQPEGWALVALDEGGKLTSSRRFSARLRQFEEGPRHGINFVVGSDLGLHESILDRASEVVSLSPMTLPHLLARLMLWEQLFRATDILGSGKYHRC